MRNEPEPFVPSKTSHITLHSHPAHNCKSKSIIESSLRLFNEGEATLIGFHRLF